MKQVLSEQRLNGMGKEEYDFWLQYERFLEGTDVAYRTHEIVNKLHEEMKPVHEQTRLLIKASEQLRAAWMEELKK